MSLRSLVFLAAISYTLIIGGSLLGYRLLVVFPALLESTIELHSNDIKAVYSAYNSERTNLVRFNLNLSKWDDTYDYAENKTPKYISSNISGSFLESGIDALAITDKNGDLLYGAQKKGNEFVETQSIIDISPDLDIETLLAHDRQFGFIRINNHFGYFASSHIQTSDETSDTNGILIFVKLLSHEFFNRINHITEAKFTHHALSDVNFFEMESDPLLDGEEFEIDDARSKYYIWVTNHISEPIGIVEVEYPLDSIPEKFDNITIYSFSALLMLPIFITIAVWIIFLAPISNMFKQIKNMSTSGTITNITIKSHVSEFKTFQIVFNGLVTKIKLYQDKLESESQTDGLTGIYNRRHFNEHYDQTWRASTRNALPLAIIMMDIDHFKKYNDHYGHQKGDEALIAVAHALQTHTRRALDLLARYGGEEFVMICQSDNEEQLKQLLSNILTSITDLNIEHVLSSTGNKLTISCGACHIINTGAWMQNHKELALKMADQALYKAKNSGRNKFYISHLDELSS